MRWLNALIETRLYRWHAFVHANFDYIKGVEAMKEIDRLKKANYELGEQVKKLGLQLEIKQMNDFLQTGRT